MLSERALARMVTTRQRMRQGRTRTVTLVYIRPEGTSFVTTEAVWRALPYTDPDVAEAGAQRSGPALHAEFGPEIDPRAIAFIAETEEATPEGVASSPHYEVVSYHAAGIIFNRWVVTLRRLR